MGLQNQNDETHVTALYVQYVLYVHLLCCSPHRLQLPAIKQEGVSIDYELHWCLNINMHSRR